MPDEIIGRLIELPNDRSVFVGRIDGERDVLIQFKNGATFQRFRLSEAATLALQELLFGTDKGTEVKYQLEDATDVKRLRWQVVKELDA